MIPPLKKGRPSKKPTEAELELLIRAGYTVKQIAEERDVSPYTVKGWIAQYRKEARLRGED